jgi:hypothetical protein
VYVLVCLPWKECVPSREKYGLYIKFNNSCKLLADNTNRKLIFFRDQCMENLEYVHFGIIQNLRFVIVIYQYNIRRRLKGHCSDIFSCVKTFVM